MAEVSASLSAERSLKEEAIQVKQELATTLQRVKKELDAERDRLNSELDEVKKCLKESEQNCVLLEKSLAREKNEKEAALVDKDDLNGQMATLNLELESMSREMKSKDETIASVQVGKGGRWNKGERARERESERERGVYLVVIYYLPYRHH